MLTPRQISACADEITRLFDPLADDILRDSVRRVAKANYVTPTAQWQTERAKALGASTQYLLQRLNNLDGITPEAAAVFAQAMLASDAAERTEARQAGTQTGSTLSPAGQQLVNSGFRRTMNTLQNLTQTRAVMGNRYLPLTHQQQLSEVMDRAHMQIASGAFSYDQAIRQAIRQLADDGIQAITYPSGHRDTLEVVVRRAALTGVSQTAGDISLNNAKEMGCDLMELSAHSGARTGNGGQNLTNHSWWQGKLVSLSGQPGYLTLEGIGYGDVRGFCGANCRHNWHPYWPGSKRMYTPERLAEFNAPCCTYNGQDLTEAQADEKQRALERAVRRWKRRYIAAEELSDPDEKARSAARLAAARAKLNDFLHQTGRQHQQLRETVAGFGRSQASSAAWTARKTNFTSSQNAGTIDQTEQQNLPETNEVSNEIGANPDVNFVCTLDRELYSVVTDDIPTDEVIITEQQILHINERHPGVYESLAASIPDVIQTPDYILRGNRPNTALVLKQIQMQEQITEIVLRLKVSSDPQDFKNSVISAWNISPKRFRRLLRQSEVLYKKE